MRKVIGLFLLLVLVFLGLAAFRKGPYTKESATTMNIQSAEKATEQKKSVKESPFACNMLALDAEGRRRHKAVTEKIRASTKEVQALPDGYAFRFSADQSTILLASEFIARERLCCPFFTFELVAEQEDGPLWLRIHGREGVKDFIKTEFGIK